MGLIEKFERVLIVNGISFAPNRLTESEARARTPVTLPTLATLVRHTLRQLGRIVLLSNVD